ncbi:MAG: formylglycine-generating enzyme family protein [Planctomyces sp.]
METLLWVLQWVVSLVGVGAYLVLVYHCFREYGAWKVLIGWYWLSTALHQEGFRNWAFFLFPPGYLLFLIFAGSNRWQNLKTPLIVFGLCVLAATVFQRARLGNWAWPNSVGRAGAVVTQQVATQADLPTKESAPAAANAGEYKEVVNTIGVQLLLIPAGTFNSGSPASEKDRMDDETQHQVTLTKPFYMGRTELTQGQWKKVMGTEPWKGKSFVKEGDDYPAVDVSWGDSVEFCKKLSAMEGKVYRLPTEAEWEYACRGGTKTSFSFGNDKAKLRRYAWYDGNLGWGKKYAQRVAQKLPNPFGLYDMHGNVWEWCSDWFGDYPSTPLTDPRGPDSGSFRVLRGGAFQHEPYTARCAVRNYDAPEGRSSDGGFRLVLE